MMKFEFEQLAGYEVSNEDYTKIIEPMYMATDLDKSEFVKTIDRKRFEQKREKSAERIQLEKDIKAEIKDLEESISWYQDKLLTYKTFYQLDGSEDWKRGIKDFTREIKNMKARIKSLKWVIA